MVCLSLKKAWSPQQLPLMILIKNRFLLFAGWALCCDFLIFYKIISETAIKEIFCYAGINKLFLEGPDSKIKGFVDQKMSIATTLWLY